MTAHIRTFLEDEFNSSSFDKARGVRNWACAQILSPLLFVVDICTDFGGQLETKRWVTTSPIEVGQILKSHKPFVWARAFLSSRTPSNDSEKLLFEELNDIYQTDIGTYVYEFADGKQVAQADLPAASIDS